MVELESSIMRELAMNFVIGSPSEDQSIAEGLSLLVVESFSKQFWDVGFIIIQSTNDNGATIINFVSFARNYKITCNQVHVLSSRRPDLSDCEGHENALDRISYHYYRIERTIDDTKKANDKARAYQTFLNEESHRIRTEHNAAKWGYDSPKDHINARLFKNDLNY